MQVTEFPEQTVIIAKDQPEYIPIPAHYSEDGIMTCCWKLTWKERLKILFTGRLWHQVLTFGSPLQPLVLCLDKPVLEETKKHHG